MHASRSSSFVTLSTRSFASADSDIQEIASVDRRVESTLPSRAPVTTASSTLDESTKGSSYNSLRKRNGKQRTNELDRDHAAAAGAGTAFPSYHRSFLGIKVSSVVDQGRQRWTKSKVALLVTVSIELALGLAALVIVLLVWLGPVTHGDVIKAANRTALILATTAACLGTTTGLLGLHGVLLNNRSMLAWYNLLLWVVLAFSASVGYVSYKMRTYDLRGKLTGAWSRKYSLLDKVAIQNDFSCCGFLDPYHQSVISQQCYTRSLLPGCLGSLLRYERKLLQAMYIVAFSVVAWQVVAIAVALASSNHVTEPFGTRKRPFKVRLKESQQVQNEKRE